MTKDEQKLIERAKERVYCGLGELTTAIDYLKDTTVKPEFIDEVNKAVQAIADLTDSLDENA